jgi:DNA polymerase III epsilon subunit-like protein
MAHGASGYNLKCDKAHEAGFDAYITGLCFVAMTKKLSKYSQWILTVKKLNNSKHTESFILWFLACVFMPSFYF